MENASSRKKLYLQELEDEIKKIDMDVFKIGGIDLSAKLNEKAKLEPPKDGKIYRTKYKLNKKGFNFDFQSIEDIILPIEYEYGTYEKGHFIPTKEKKVYRDDIDDIDETMEELLESKKRGNKNKDNIIEEKKEESKNQKEKSYNSLMFEEELIPSDEEEIGEPPIISVEVSDIDVKFDEQEEEENMPIPDKAKQILVAKESPVENNLQFTEHILDQAKSPIDMLTIGEKVYELINKKDNSSEVVDLWPLNTYKKNNNNINVQLFRQINMDRQCNQFIQNSKSILSDYISLEQEEEVPTTIIIDNRDYRTNCSVWFGTNKAKLIRIPICIKPSKECQGLVLSLGEAGITCIDIFENILILGHVDGTIQIMEEQKVLDKIKDNKAEIMQIKFLKVNSKKKKYEFIYSDASGNVNYVKRAKYMLMSRNSCEPITSSNEFPIYKICLYSQEKDLKITKKKNILIGLVSLKNVLLYKIRPKTENQCIREIEIPYCSVGDFVFDCDFGYGFPPIPELNLLNEKEKKGSISLIENSLIEGNKKEKLLFAVSYGVFIRLFEIDLKKNNSVGIVEIGHYITDSPVCKLGFISKSYLTIIDNNKSVKIINTFCFENSVNKELNSPTTNNIITYDNIDLRGYNILKQNNIFFINLNDGKRCLANTNFLGSALIFKQNIFIISKEKFLLYKLNRWDEIINNLCQNEEYTKMMWLSTFLLGINKNLMAIESDENIEQEYNNSLQESLYIFLIKGISKENYYKEIRMLIEYCIRTGRFKDFYEAKDALIQKKLSNYLYEYTTEYVFNGNFYKFEFDKNFLEDYINYYLGKNEIIFLSKILIKISVNNLNKPEIFKILEENEIINPFIYATIKERDSNKSDHFKPIEYLFKLFEKKKNEEQNKNDKIKEEYFKLITEHDMKFYYDKTLSCNDYIGHKIIWYANKCLKNEEYPKGNPLPNEAFEETSKKIFLFLTLENVMEILVQFDSFSYFNLLTRIFTEHKLIKIMKTDVDKKKYPYSNLESFVKSYLSNISVEQLSEKYFYYGIKNFVYDKTKTFKNNFYIKYDFYQMTASICDKRKDKDNMLFIDRVTLIDAIKFFINYGISIEKENSSNCYDPFICHKIPKKTEFSYKEFYEKIENNILFILQYLKKYQDFFESDLDELFSLEGLKNNRKIRTYLCEFGKKYDELFNIKLEEFNAKNPVLSREKNLLKFFEWIDKTLEATNKIESKNKNYHKNFKDFLKKQFVTLCGISVGHLYNIIKIWFQDELKDICFSLGSDELKCYYIDQYITMQNNQDIKDNKYDDYLMMKLELLIKNGYKEQIIKMVENNKYLWDNKYLDYLIKNEVYDAAIFISQKRDNIENCIKLSEAQIKSIFNSVKNTLLNYSEKVSYDVVIIKLDEIKKYLDLGLTACSSWTEANKNYTMNEIKNTWLKPLDLFYHFRNELKKINKNNQLVMEYESDVFNLILKKTEQNILENIEYILSKMNDYIPLSFIVEVLCDLFKKSKFKEYSKMFQRMFKGTRRIEEIFKSVSNLLYDSISNQQNELLIESQKGLYCDINECNYCNKPIEENMGINKVIYFHCGHIYHSFCCALEKGKYSCYICRINDSEESMFTDIPILSFRKKQNVIKNEMKNELKIKAKKEEEKMKNIKQKLIGKLNRIKKKKIDKFENFKSNVDNIGIKI